MALKGPILTGKVEDIQFTSGGAGNQFTTIDGVKYATYWDFRQGVREGVWVWHQPYMGKLFHNSVPSPHTHIVCVHGEERPA